MTVKRKILCTLLAAILMFGIALLSSCEPSESPNENGGESNTDGETADGEEIKNYESSAGLLYELNDDGSAYVCTGIGTATDDNLVIGSSYNGLPVTGIGENAFAYNNNFHSIIIPESIKFIGKGAFEGCNSLTYTLLDGALYLGNNENKYYAFIKFANSGYSSEFVMNEGTGVMTSGVFEGRSELKKIVLSEKITQIGNNEFSGCTNLESISFGQNSKLTSIGAGAFVNCSKLLSVAIPKGVTEIPAGMFSGCSSLVEITLPSLSSHIGYVFGEEYYANAVKTASTWNADYYIPQTLKKINISGGDIPGYAFQNCNLIEKITFEYAKNIGASSFESCSSLTNITIPNSVTSIGDSAFKGCNGLTYNEYDNALYLGNSENSHFALVESKNTNISSCEINSNTKVIASGAFKACAELKAITFEENSKLNGIGYEAFYNCTSLESITIPSSVTSIGDSAFSRCTSLNSVHISSIENWLKISFYDSSANPLYYAHNLYLNGNLVTDVTVPDTITKINNYVFYGCRSLTSITIPNSVTNIGKSAFRGCKSLENITIPNGVTSIEPGTFSYCDSLESITIPNSITNIGDYAFSRCTSLETLTFGENSKLERIGEEAFYNCSRLTSITIPNGVTSIGSFAFEDCTALSRIVIPNSIANVGFAAFRDCTSLVYNEDANALYLGNNENPYLVLIEVKNKKITSFEVNPGTKVIYSNAFLHCANLINITISESIINIGDDAFLTCESLNAVHISSIESWLKISFGNYNANPLYYAHNLYLNGSLVTEVTVPNTITNIKIYTFSGCTSLESITIPNSVITISPSAFYGCTSLVYNEYDNALYLGNNENPFLVLVEAKSTDISSCEINLNTKSIASGAFSDCQSLQSITIPDSITIIGSAAFYNCLSLSRITFSDTTTWYRTESLSDCENKTNGTKIDVTDPRTNVGNFIFIVLPYFYSYLYKI